MAEYIEREAAIAALDEFRLNETVSKYATVMQCRAARDAISRAAKVLESLPAPDVEPVKHGRWIYREFDDEYGWRQEYECSECGKYSYFDTDFCPNCGARMNEEAQNER